MILLFTYQNIIQEISKIKFISMQFKIAFSATDKIQFNFKVDINEFNQCDFLRKKFT